MVDWDERFESGSYPQHPDPAPVLKRYVDGSGDGRALDVATGTGRNAVFLAEHGYAVDALDKSRAGLETTRRNAAERGVAGNLNCIQTDIPSHTFPEGTYDIVTVSFYRAVDRFPDLKAALAPGGLFFVEHHLRTADPVEGGPSGDRYRFAANELLNSCLDLTVLSYEEGIEVRDDGRESAIARIVARNASGRQSYPRIREWQRQESGDGRP